MAKLDTTCPICGAMHARKLSLVYEEGRTQMQSTSHSVGTTNTIGRVTVTTHGTSQGIHQSDASRSAAPPPVPSFRSEAEHIQSNIRLLSFAALLVLPMIGSAFDWGFFISIFSGVAALVGGLIYAQTLDGSATDDEIEQHRTRNSAAFDALDEWERTFACMSCGHRFTPKALTT
jgi:hypothetical protein